MTSVATVLRYENSCGSVSAGCGCSYAPVVGLLPTFHNSTVEGNSEIRLGDSENKVKTFLQKR